MSESHFRRIEELRVILTFEGVLRKKFVHALVPTVIWKTIPPLSNGASLKDELSSPQFIMSRSRVYLEEPFNPAFLLCLNLAAGENQSLESHKC